MPLRGVVVMTPVGRQRTDSYTNFGLRPHGQRLIRVSPQRGLTSQPRAERSAALGYWVTDLLGYGVIRLWGVPCFALSGLKACRASSQGGAPRLRRCALPWADLLSPFGAKSVWACGGGDVIRNQYKNRFFAVQPVSLQLRPEGAFT